MGANEELDIWICQFIIETEDFNILV